MLTRFARFCAVDLIAKSLDVGNTGTVDPTAFIQEAHNFRHHRRAEQLHSTLVWGSARKKTHEFYW